MKHLLICAMIFFTFEHADAQRVYEDFEGGSKANWQAINGLAYESVPNPSKDAVNGSDNVGRFSNNGNSDFCFGLGDIAPNADLSSLNYITIKIWSPSTTRALLKFEGGGKAIEKFIDITTTNAWVEYGVDFSSAAPITSLNKVLLAFNPFTTPKIDTFYFDDIIGLEAKTTFNTFETTGELTWNSFDGTYEAPVANPAPNRVNETPNCAKYTKSGAHAYSLLLADNGKPFNMNVLNQFKVSIHASAPTQVLCKLEGPGGPPIEKIANIAVDNAWQEYTFDFSAAKDYKHLTKAIFFFDPGVETSADIYHFDNFYAVSAGACSGTVINPNIIDDFECQRNGTLDNGWEAMTTIANPAPDAVNGSASVGRYEDPLNAPWDALVYDYQNSIDLSTKNQLNAKVWSSKATKLLFKLEGGASAPKEIWVDITKTNQWVEYSVDFSNQSASQHKRVAIFFNGGQEAAPGDVYFLDDVLWSEKRNIELENFDNGSIMSWAPLDGDGTLHTEFKLIDNPDATGNNTTPKVGEAKKGSSPFSTLQGFWANPIDLSLRPQINMMVWAPAGSKTITMQLESTSAGNKEVTRDITKTASWEVYSFNFEEHKSITDWASLKIILDAGTASDGTIYYFDQINQSEATVDPCEGSIPITNIIDDFECQRNYEYGAGSQLISAVKNPQIDGSNGSPSVGLYKEQPNQPWDALCAEIPDGLQLDIYNQLELQVLSPIAAPFLMKLEGGTDPAKEEWTEITETNKWVTLSRDFSSQIGKNHKRVCFFFNGGVETPNETNVYIDNIRFAHAPYNGCLMDFENPAFTSTSWRYFPADNSGAFEIVNNPKKSGINTSAKVGLAVEKASGEQVWQGMFTDLESYIALPESKRLSMKVLSPKVGAITMKLETPQVPGFPGSSGDNTIRNTKADEWEELTWDFSTSPTPIDPAGKYIRVTLIWDIENVPTSDVTYYFDDLRIEGATGCTPGSSGTIDIDLTNLEVTPNPVSDLLQVINAEEVQYFTLTNIYGQKLARVQSNGQSTYNLSVANLPSGTYVIMGHNSQGIPIARTRFIKM